ncbi:multicopper oxidase type 3 [Halanaeroarchaeum sulfurireducens]|uniref:Multicopper oxidase type 3 n=1 Tax=Halanaeroarchaeum sulfurireducens TaxID=1604004 RepID=A0A0F7PD38_9EURY|nr:multicopper oxidase type 3 [Halanaeroarchaeum sulfurireducens]ALG81955.1 multicopper oxidase type 3 [Halanaeroarchaeum sulfurireducens]
MTVGRNAVSRRRALQILGGGGLIGLAGCTSAVNPLSDQGSISPGEEPSVKSRDPPSGPPDTAVELTPEPAGEDSPAGVSAETWLYNDALPGPEIRAAEGDVIGVSLENGLSARTTVHWHGIPLANAMDGVPNVTQAPVEPGESFDYRFRAEPAGTYFYHSHAGLQLDRGLAGPLVIEESDPHVEYDREHVIVLDDYLSQAPRAPDSDGASEMQEGGPMGGMMNVYRPPYTGMIMNGRLASNAPFFDVTEGDRVRLRFVNASSATMFQVRTAGHQLDISHADGRPVEPVSADSFTFGPGERYDAIITADNPGTWEILADPVRGSEPSARGILRYEGEEERTPTPSEMGGRELSYDDLRAIEPIEGLDGTPDRTFDLTLSPGGDGYSWAIDGQTYPDADPLDVAHGDHVRIRMQNRSPVSHPMHVHGHFFQVGTAVKDTVVVPGRMGQTTIDFKADNPGNWFFHCHNLYHLEAGMARVIRYV